MSSHPSGRVIPASKFTIVQHKQLARIFQLIDVDHDGLLSDAEARTMFVAASVAPTAKLLERAARRCPATWKGKGYDFDTLVACIEEDAIVDPLSADDLSLVFEHFSANPSQNLDFANPHKIRSRATSPARSTAPAGHSIPAYSMRHVLAGVPTADETQLTDEEVDRIFVDLGIKTERDRIRYLEFFTKLSGGYLRVVNEAPAASS